MLVVRVSCLGFGFLISGNDKVEHLRLGVVVRSPSAFKHNKIVFVESYLKGFVFPRVFVNHGSEAQGSMLDSHQQWQSLCVNVQRKAGSRTCRFGVLEK